ncbi:MAG TPA: hypothetical protein VF465_14445, partial [Flavobacterium sp.]|uniref:hypothetical protein n=1 Tax=Flavobacterium sp. TaxID=239 RepID=UPI002ED27442
ITSDVLESSVLTRIGLVWLVFGLFGLLISVIYQLVNKRWFKGLITLVLFGGTIVVFIGYMVVAFFIEQETPDTWAKNLTIPKNIQIDNPVDLDFGAKFESQRPDSITNQIVTKTELQLYNSFQPGLYEYDFWIGKIESGSIYLKAFEITHNEALSVDELPRASSIQVYNPTDSIKKFSTGKDFTIYEGDWGDPYAARFEVWFKPDNGKNERKLFSKNYKIEGWMR